MIKLLKSADAQDTQSSIKHLITAQVNCPIKCCVFFSFVLSVLVLLSYVYSVMLINGLTTTCVCMYQCVHTVTLDNKKNHLL